MSLQIFTHLLPTLFDPAQLAGTQAVVIDILRASSTITTALLHGADKVVPCLQVEEAFELRNSLGTSASVLGGERGGVPIEGFDYGNSPSDYTRENITGQTVIFTTTNGTKALQSCRAAERVLIGCFLNLSAVVASLRESELPIHLICAGTNGEITLEDCLFAGHVAAHLSAAEPQAEVNDATQLCLSLHQTWAQRSQGIHRALLASQGGRNLAGLEMHRDIAYCAATDRFFQVPVWDAGENKITLD